MIKNRQNSIMCGKNITIVYCSIHHNFLLNIDSTLEEEKTEKKE